MIFIVRRQLFSNSPTEANPSCLLFQIWACPRQLSHTDHLALSELSVAIASGFGDNSLLFIALNTLDNPPNNGGEYLWFLFIKDKVEARRQERSGSRGEEWMHSQLAKSQKRRFEESIAEAGNMVDPLKRIVF